MVKYVELIYKKDMQLKISKSNIVVELISVENVCNMFQGSIKGIFLNN